MSTEQRRWILCGGLASGKSTVRRLLEERGIVTIDADSIGHQVLEPDGLAFGEVAQVWPDVVVDGHIDRGRLAGIVFSDRTELERLEAIIHPHIFKLISQRAEAVDGPVVVEMPLLGERLGGRWSRIVVDCRDEIRLNRAVERGMDEKDARGRLEAQPSRAEWLAAGDVVVPNHGGRSNLMSSAEALVGIL